MKEESGPYILVARLGEGGMAEVFKAVKKGPDGFEKPVALKRILPHFADQEAFMRMLSAEARLHAHLDHPNLVQILDFFREGTSYMIALEYVPGKNLRKFMEDSERTKNVTPWACALHIVSEVLLGLDYAHKRRGPKGPLGIVHRDVSPQNILLSYDGWVKLTDFGIALGNVDREKTDAGIVKGKCRYVAPEQLTSKPIDQRADIFSAGVVLYELLFGTYPFGDGSDFEIMARISRGEVITPSKALQEMPSALHDITLKSLRPNPNDRFEDAAKFREALRGVQDPKWLSTGQSQLRAQMSHLYPRRKDQPETPIHSTKVFADLGPNVPKTVRVEESLISAAGNWIPENTEQDVPPRRARWINHSILAVTFAVSAWFLIGSLKTTSVEPSAVSERSRLSSDLGEAKKAMLAVTPAPSPSSSPLAAPTRIAKKPVVATIRVGRLSLTGPPGTKVYVRGKWIGSLPMPDRDLEEGTYFLSMEAPGIPIRHTNIRISQGATKLVDFKGLSLR